MKKSLFIIAGAALILSSCVQEDIRNDFNGGEDLLQAISFETFAQKATRGAENSSATQKYGLEAYHTSFKLWGSKYVGTGSGDVVFSAQVVNGTASGDWSYSPIRFWDKSADKYDFYAAAPSGLSWVFNNDTKKISLSSFSVDGESLDIMTSCSADAVMPNSKDIMISTDVTREGLLSSKNYNTVNLEFNHILSRLNIAVKKSNVLKDFTVRLDILKVFDMLKTGAFDESAASGAALASGTVNRWTASTTYNFGFEASGDGEEISSGDTYFYQGLVIPQEIGYESIKLDGTGTVTKPYLKIGYSLYDASGDAVPGGEYVYFYNLADIFNGNGSASGDAVEFCEGWMNTLKITIKPDVIEFCPEVFEWAEKSVGPVYVPDINK